MSLFNEFDLNQRVDKIKVKIDSATDPNKIAEISEHGISVAARLLEETRADLDYIKNKVGYSHNGYLEVSGSVALAATGCVRIPISMISAMLSLSNVVGNSKSELRSKIGDAARVMSQVSSMHMSHEMRQLINKVVQEVTQAETKINGGVGGCFVATFVYDDYNAEEVLVLRYFRDSVLRTSFVGRVVVEIYYLVSPALVIVFSKIPNSKKWLRFFTDIFVLKIQQK